MPQPAKNRQLDWSLNVKGNWSTHRKCVLKPSEVDMQANTRQENSPQYFNLKKQQKKN